MMLSKHHCLMMMFTNCQCCFSIYQAVSAHFQGDVELQWMHATFIRN